MADDYISNLVAKALSGDSNTRTQTRPTAAAPSGLDPEMQEKIDKLSQEVKARGGRLSITSGRRSTERQAQLYANRANNPYPVAPPGSSKHERGRAADLAWSGIDQDSVVKIADELGLQWGGRFKRTDPVHFQLPDGDSAGQVAPSGRQTPATIVSSILNGGTSTKKPLAPGPRLDMLPKTAAENSIPSGPMESGEERSGGAPGIGSYLSIPGEENLGRTRAAAGNFGRGWASVLASPFDLASVIQSYLTGTPIDETLNAQAAKWIRNTNVGFGYPDAPDEYQKSFLYNDLPQGAGNLAGMIMGGVASGGSRLATAAIGGALGAQQGVTDAEESGATPEQTRLSGLLNIPIGLVDSLVPGEIAGEMTGKVVRQKFLRSLVEKSLEEGSTEYVQQIGQNAVARGIGYAPDRPWDEGAWRAAAAGAILGGGAETLTHGINLDPQRKLESEGHYVGQDITGRKFVITPDGELHTQDGTDRVVLPPDAIDYISNAAAKKPKVNGQEAKFGTDTKQGDYIEAQDGRRTYLEADRTPLQQKEPDPIVQTPETAIINVQTQSRVLQYQAQAATKRIIESGAVKASTETPSNFELGSRVSYTSSISGKQSFGIIVPIPDDDILLIKNGGSSPDRFVGVQLEGSNFIGIVPKTATNLRMEKTFHSSPSESAETEMPTAQIPIEQRWQNHAWDYAMAASWHLYNGDEDWFKNSQESLPESNRLSEDYRDELERRARRLLRGGLAQSQARDATGNILRLYHGTPEAYHQYSPTKDSGINTYGEGFNTADDPGPTAGAYSEGFDLTKKDSSPNVRPVFLDLHNPLDLRTKEGAEKLKIAAREASKNPDTISKLTALHQKIDSWWSDKDTRDELRSVGEATTEAIAKEKGLESLLFPERKADVEPFYMRTIAEGLGFDGIAHTGGEILAPGLESGSHYNVWIAFKPEQIVPALYTDNTKGLSIRETLDSIVDGWKDVVPDAEAYLKSTTAMLEPVLRGEVALGYVVADGFHDPLSLGMIQEMADRLIRHVEDNELPVKIFTREEEFQDPNPPVDANYRYGVSDDFGGDDMERVRSVSLYAMSPEATKRVLSKYGIGENPDSFIARAENEAFLPKTPEKAAIDELFSEHRKRNPISTQEAKARIQQGVATSEDLDLPTSGIEEVGRDLYHPLISYHAWREAMIKEFDGTPGLSGKIGQLWDTIKQEENQDSENEDPNNILELGDDRNSPAYKFRQFIENRQEFQNPMGIPNGDGNGYSLVLGKLAGGDTVGWGRWNDDEGIRNEIADNPHIQMLSTRLEHLTGLLGEFIAQEYEGLGNKEVAEKYRAAKWGGFVMDPRYYGLNYPQEYGLTEHGVGNIYINPFVMAKTFYKSAYLYNIPPAWQSGVMAAKIVNTLVHEIVHQEESGGGTNPELRSDRSHHHNDEFEEAYVRVAELTMQFVEAHEQELIKALDRETLREIGKYARKAYNSQFPPEGGFRDRYAPRIEAQRRAEARATGNFEGVPPAPDRGGGETIPQRTGYPSGWGFASDGVDEPPTRGKGPFDHPFLDFTISEDAIDKMMAEGRDVIDATEGDPNRPSPRLLDSKFKLEERPDDFDEEKASRFREKMGWNPEDPNFQVKSLEERIQGLKADSKGAKGKDRIDILKQIVRLQKDKNYVLRDNPEAASDIKDLTKGPSMSQENEQPPESNLTDKLKRRFQVKADWTPDTYDDGEPYLDKDGKQRQKLQFKVIDSQTGEERGSFKGFAEAQKGADSLEKSAKVKGEEVGKKAPTDTPDLNREKEDYYLLVNIFKAKQAKNMSKMIELVKEARAKGIDGTKISEATRGRSPFYTEPQTDPKSKEVPTAIAPKESIKSFRGTWLSNFHSAKVELDGKSYPSVEHAYQAAKTLNEGAREKIRQAPTAAAAKAMGRKIPMRPDWNKVKLQIMKGLLQQKFSHPELKEKLLATEGRELIEGNTWGDVYWGVSNGRGQNNLGKLLMEIRDNATLSTDEDTSARFGPSESAVDEAPTEAPIKGKPLIDERPSRPELTQAQLKLDIHKDFYKMAGEVLAKKGVKRNRAVTMQQQTYDTIVNASAEDLIDINRYLENKNIDLTSFMLGLAMPTGSDAGRVLNTLSQVAKSLGDKARREPSFAKELERIQKSQLTKLDSLGQGLYARWTGIFKGAMVAAWSTATRNAASQGARLGIDAMVDGLDGALQVNRELADRPGGVHPLDGLEILLQLGKEAKTTAQQGAAYVKGKLTGKVQAAPVSVADQLLSALPGLSDKLYQTFLSDVENVDLKLRPRATKAERFTGKVEDAVQLLNALNVAQEFTVRRSVFVAKMFQEAKNNNIDLHDIIERNDRDAMKNLPKEMWEASIHKALDASFAAEPEGEVGIRALQTMRAIQKHPLGMGVLFDLPFPRFLIQALKFHYQYSPVSIPELLFSDKAKAQIAAGDHKRIARAAIGTAMLGIGYAMAAARKDDERWYEFYGFDTRPFNPFAGYMFLGDAIYRKTHGLEFDYTASEFINSLMALGSRADTSLTILGRLVGVVTQEDSKGVGQHAAEYAGDVVSRFFQPATTVKDIYASTFDKWAEYITGHGGDEAVLRDVDTENPLIAPTMNKFPGLSQMLPEAQSPTRAEAPRQKAPWAKQLLGLRFVEDRNPLESEIQKANMKFREVFTSSGDVDFDRDMLHTMGELNSDPQISAYLQSQQFQALPQETKAYILSELESKVREAARATAVGKNPNKYLKFKFDSMPKRERKLVLSQMPERPPGL